MSKRVLALGLFCCIALLLAACGQTAIPTSLPTEAILPTAATTGNYEPIDAAECTALQQELTVALGVEFDQGTAPFEDYAAGGRGTCCLLKATGTGVDFPNEIAVVSSLQFLLEDLGWVLDIRYTADGPTGTAFGLSKDNQLALASVMWTPSANANCPEDQPIGACDLQPEQKLYTITVRAAKK